MAAERPNLLVVTGPPGAGKSTVAGLLVRRFERSVLVEGDAFFAFLREGAVPPWLPGSSEQNDVVIRAAAAATGHFAAGGYVTVYDGVVGPWGLPRFAGGLGQGIGSLAYAVLLPDEERCVYRVRSRPGHGFTDEGATRKMHAEFSAACAGLDERHVLRDPPASAEATADAVEAAWSSGSLTYGIA